MLSNTLVALSLVPLSLAHFQLNYPTARGFDDDKESNFPCGSFDDVQQQRTNFSISGSPVQLNLGHAQTNLAVYMAIGSDPGSGFSIVATQQFTVDGLGNFCLGSVSVPAGLNVSDGTLASIQVVSNDQETGSGGLYQCADVLLVKTSLSQTDYNNNCKNNTGVKVGQENISGNPNGTSSGSAVSAASATARPTGAAAQAKAVSWVLGAVGFAAMVML